MIEILLQLADLGSTVTIVVTKKDENYLISITPKTASNNLQPVLISGTQTDILNDLPNLLKGMGEMKKNISNLESINKKLEKKVEEKANPTATTTAKAAEKTAAKKGPLKVGSGATKEPAADLFAAAATAPKEEPKVDDTEELDNEEEVNNEEVVDNTPEPEETTPVVEAPTPEPEPEVNNQTQEEEEEIF